jgi:HEAT repeat protein
LSRRLDSFPDLQNAMNSSESATRLVALSAIARFDPPEALPVLLRATRDKDEGVRNAAIGFLAAQHGSAATQQLAGLLSDHPLRGLVLNSLALPVEGRIPGLLAGLEYADDQVAPLLVGALARMNRADATAAIFESLTMAGPAGRRAAATALACMGTTAARGALERAAREDSNPEVRRICSLALVG